jgi:hypothetical protein
MYTTINGIYEKGQVILKEPAPTEKSMRVLVVFVEENNPVLTGQTTIEQALEPKLKQHFSERWQGQFNFSDKKDDARLDYLKQRYQL